MLKPVIPILVTLIVGCAGTPESGSALNAASSREAPSISVCPIKGYSILDGDIRVTAPSSSIARLEERQANGLHQLAVVFDGPCGNGNDRTQSVVLRLPEDLQGQSLVVINPLI